MKFGRYEWPDDGPCFRCYGSLRPFGQTERRTESVVHYLCALCDARMDYVMRGSSLGWRFPGTEAA